MKFIKINFPHIAHLSFNFIDPVYQAMKNKWTIPTYSQTEKEIYKTVKFMKQNNLTFRIERLPLCYMSGFEEFSSDIRRGFFNEIRMISLLKAKGDIQEKELIIEKNTKFYQAKQCKKCKLKLLCPGINPNYVEIHGSNEVFPIFKNPIDIINKIEKTNLKKKSEFEKKIITDLKLFKHAIKIKTNKNNVYDTYSHFLMRSGGIKTEEFIYNSWKQHLKLIKEKKNKDLLSFYIHIPFCESNCNYCCYPSTKLENKKQLNEYYEYLIIQIKKYAKLFKNYKFKTLYIGGGTPSIFSEKQLKNILELIFKNYKFEKYCEKAIELNPKSTTIQKLKILEMFEFNKISIGVQSLSKRILDINERKNQTTTLVNETIQNFKKLDLNYLNVDLLLGLKNDTVKDFLYTFEEICKMGPSNICIYPLKTNDKYIKKNYKTFEKFTEFYYPLFDNVSKQIIPIAKKYNFNEHYKLEKLSYIAPLVFSKTKQKTKQVDFHYTHFNLPPYSNFCLGFYSHSRIINKIDYMLINKNNQDSMFLKGFSTNPKEYIYLTQKLDPNFEKVKFIIKTFYQHWEIPRKLYKEYYGTDIVQDFAYAIKALSHLNILKVHSDKIIFKKMDEKKLYPYLLFFAGRKNVMKKI
ncbi:radical SAM protein [Candidatus Woesearchaeota archaeon]|nr:radical SAM protein [Candidatus Woesearchaeota archaeon]